MSLLSSEKHLGDLGLSQGMTNTDNYDPSENSLFPPTETKNNTYVETESAFPFPMYPKL